MCCKTDGSGLYHLPYIQLINEQNIIGINNIHLRFGIYVNSISKQYIIIVFQLSYSFTIVNISRVNFFIFFLLTKDLIYRIENFY